MLASSGQLPPDDGRWAYEPKWDGFRAIVHVNSRAVVWSRRGTDLTDRFPEVRSSPRLSRSDTVLYGELVVFDASAARTSRPSASGGSSAPPSERPAIETVRSRLTVV